ncbi:two-component sensor histidine kinase [Oceanidesulfovibrio indonesiensis]|uniref:histidine kinase n=1 Tax=Oceanidesulfovibrio indonesiensis TaxID=54767 RepID=A0A7M3MJ56_9BACT|nr:HAMP domain-containing sensor histidine kinase [Oceanidesulfovibrio indonesiensis]TVM19843.1 two-component sensor histidine kinase [Oceanidesulfovibrio indonesiensis]
MFHKVSLRLALIIFVVAPQAIALFIFGYSGLHVLEGHVEKRMQKDLELVARAIQLPLSYALERDRMGSVVQALESAFSIGRVYSAYVYDNAGKTIAVAGLNDPNPEAGRLTKVAAEGKEHGEYGKVAGQEVYSYFVPLTGTGGQINGLLQLTRKGNDFRQDLMRIRIQGVFWLLASVLVISLLVVFGHNKILGGHVGRLYATMRRVAAGDRSCRVQPSGPRETTQLGRGLNSMLDSMDRAEQEIEQRRAMQRELEQRLRQSEKLAAIGQVAAGVAHELGTPLSVIDAKAQRACRKIPPDSYEARTMLQIREEARRMELIIRQLLNFSHRGALRYRKLNPEDVARSAAGALEHEADQRNIQLLLEGQSDCEGFEADPIRIEQVLANLLRNALQAPNARRVRLSWRCGTDGGAVFTVDDDGDGIDPDSARRLFEPFFTTKSPGEGTGLGLALAQSIVEEHGGHLATERSDLGGARFVVTLPARPPQIQANEDQNHAAG